MPYTSQTIYETATSPLSSWFSLAALVMDEMARIEHHIGRIRGD